MHLCGLAVLTEIRLCHAHSWFASIDRGRETARQAASAKAEAAKAAEADAAAKRRADPDAQRIGGWMVNPTRGGGEGGGGGGGGGVGKYLSAEAFKH
eukprot:COSAG01_NODE_5256_length_4381_cov_2.177487_4_plen_97_part_00